MPSTTTGGLIKTSQQWTPEQYEWLRARMERLGLRSLSATVAMLVQETKDAERARQERVA